MPSSSFIAARVRSGGGRCGWRLERWAGSWEGRSKRWCQDCLVGRAACPPAGSRLHRRWRLDALLAAIDPGRLPGPTCMRAKEPLCDSSSGGPEGNRVPEEAGTVSDLDASPPAPTGSGEHRPLLMVDIDGVISLFGPPGRPGPTSPPAPTGSSNDRRHPTLPLHDRRHTPAEPRRDLSTWSGASGWEEKAEEYLPHLLGLPAGLPFLRFERMTGPPPARAGRSIDGHWKLDAIDAYAGGRALAWIDDAFDDSCHAWAERSAPTLLVQTDPANGLTSKESSLLAAWARDPSPTGT